MMICQIIISVCKGEVLVVTKNVSPPKNETLINLKLYELGLGL